MSREVFDDDTILEGFKNLRDIIQAQKELNETFHKRLKLLEASQSRQTPPLVLTKEMEVKNQRMVPHQTLSHLKNYKVGTTLGCMSHHALRIVFIRSRLIPGPIGARCVTVDHLQLDLGSVSTGYSDRPWPASKQQTPGLILTGPESYKLDSRSGIVQDEFRKDKL